MNLTEWRAWRRKHYADGDPRPDAELGGLLEHLLSTRRGAIAVLRADRRYAKEQRPQHTDGPCAFADPALRTAYRHKTRNRRRA